ncbi:TetR/AcrR family transcriptional regulator [Rhodococcus fascians]|nr:TetR/AcrR family transcriptional regulator [Rhodococcus fascians]MBY4432678.1 TetR/AcrR family transcriptional regulator [Rhodococcus fascians]
MGRGEKPATVRPKDRRTAVLSGALDLFADRGFDQVTITDIGESAGVSAGAVYRHISNKQELLDYPIREIVVAGFATSLLAVERNVPTEQILDELICSMVTVAVDHPKEVLLFHRESRRVSRLLREDLVNLRSRTVQYWVDVVVAHLPELSPAAAEFRVRASWGLLNCTPLIHGTVLRTRLVDTLVKVLEAVVLGPDLIVEIPISSSQYPPVTEIDSRREQLLRHGARLFRDKGYYQVGVDEIGEALGIRGPSFYLWFPRKSDLLFEILQRVADKFDTVHLSTTESGTERIRAMIRRYVALAMQNQDYIAVHAVERQHLPDDLRKQIERRRQQRTALWVQELREVRPEVPEAVIKIVVLATLEMVMAVARSARYGAVPEIEKPLAALAFAALMSDV